MADGAGTTGVVSAASAASTAKQTGEEAGAEGEGDEESEHEVAEAEADLHPHRFPHLSWAEGDLAASLDAVYHWVEGEAIRAASWYLHEKKPKARWSRLLRIVAILLATAGAALPFVAANTGR